MSRLARLVLIALIGAFLLAVLAVDGFIALERAFQVDEVEHVHAAYNMAAGQRLYADFRQVHNPLLYVALEPLIDVDDPVASFRRTRFFMAGLFVLNLGLIAFCAYKLSGRPAALLAAGFALVHSTFVERGLEVRTDGALGFCVIAALAIELLPWPRLRRSCAEAFVLSLAFLFTNKAAFACFAFGCLWLADAIRERRPGRVLLPMAFWIAPLVAAGGVAAAAGNLDGFVDVNVGFALGEMTYQTPYERDVRPGERTWRYLRPEMQRNLVSYLLTLAGWVVLWGRGRRFTVWLAFMLFLSLWLNPFPYPYLHATVLPVFLVLAGIGAAAILNTLKVSASSFQGLLAATVLLALATSTSAGRLVLAAASSADAQFEHLLTLEEILDEDDAVFDMAGLYFQPDGHPVYCWPGTELARYVNGIFPRIPDELRRRETVALVMNYRFNWLPEEEQRFLNEHFVHWDRNVHVLGRDLTGLAPGEEIVFEMLKEKRMRYEGSGSITVDGAAFTEGTLTRGEHVVRRLDGRGGRLVLATEEPGPQPPGPREALYDFFQ